LSDLSAIIFSSAKSTTKCIIRQSRHVSIIEPNPHVQGGRMVVTLGGPADGVAPDSEIRSCFTSDLRCCSCLTNTAAPRERSLSRSDHNARISSEG
jgi:hypothetical protein